MKKLLLLGVAIAGCVCGTNVFAESVSGKVVSTDGNTVVVQQQNGQKSTMQVTPETTYRKKKAGKDKMKNSSADMKNQAYYTPILEEDDWVDIIYSPTADSMLIIEDVVIYDD